MGLEEVAKADTFSITVEFSLWFQVMVIKQFTHCQQAIQLWNLYISQSYMQGKPNKVW